MTMNREDAGTYRALQRHLNTMPIGFPKTRSGSELAILRALFSEEDARLALLMNYKPEPVEAIRARMGPEAPPTDALERQLTRLAHLGAIYTITRDGTRLFCLHPWVVGMYEIAFAAFEKQGRPVDVLIKDNKDFTLRFGLQLLFAEKRGFRTIPIEQSVTPEHHIATYDELSSIIERNDGKFAMVPCACKRVSQIEGQGCSITSRVDVCMAMRDYAAIAIEAGIGREISKDEAISIARQNETDGLVLQPENAQDPNWICACCGDCCGLLELLRAVPRPADFAHGNFHATIDNDACVGCGACVARCQMNAIQVNGKTRKAAVNLARCIGCGLCVPACKVHAATLVPNKTPYTPPQDLEALMDDLQAHKKSKLQKAALVAKVLLRVK